MNAKVRPRGMGFCSWALATLALTTLIPSCHKKEQETKPIGPDKGAQSTSEGKMAAQGTVRPAAKAGTWYPGDRSGLAKTVDDYVQKAKSFTGGQPRALISPHAGMRFSGATAGYGYRALQGHRYRRVFLIGPAHTARFDGISVSTDSFYETPLGRVPVDRAVADALAAAPPFTTHKRAHQQEHCLELQLPFLQRTLAGSFSIVPLLVSQITPEQVRQAAAELRTVVGLDDLVIASSDFTHYGPNFNYVPFKEDIAANLKKLTDQAYEKIQQHDVDGFLAHRREKGDTICGFLPIAILLAMLPEKATTTRLHFDTSGNITGDYRNSVSYLSVAITGPAWSPIPKHTRLNQEQKKTALQIARSSVEQWVKEQTVFEPKKAGLDLSGELGKALGVFVTLKKHDRLRGCIGNIIARGPLYEAIVGRAIDAAARDRRFSPVKPAELAELEYEISVLTVPRAVPTTDQIILGRDGVILSKGSRRAVYLPQVAPEQGWNLDETLNHLAVKAGLGRDGWRRGAKFETFQALVF